jgi:hypothetical protein
MSKYKKVFVPIRETKLDILNKIAEKMSEGLNIPLSHIDIIRSAIETMYPDPRENNAEYIDKAIKRAKQLQTIQRQGIPLNFLEQDADIMERAYKKAGFIHNGIRYINFDKYLNS